MLRVGLTGSIATGKSHASRVFAELGAHVIDADRIAHDLMSPGRETYQKVVQAFGNDILSPDGTIDRKKLGRIVFNNSEKRLLLNSLVHPDVRSEVLRRIVELERVTPAGIVIVDAALMIESGSYKAYQRVIVVYCDPAQQLARIMERDGLTIEEARARVAAQMPMEEKLKYADYKIDTSGTFQQTRERIEQVYRDLTMLSLKEVRGQDQ
jgi:dephospho-CoA kinase